MQSSNKLTVNNKKTIKTNPKTTTKKKFRYQKLITKELLIQSKLKDRFKTEADQEIKQI